MTDTVAHVIENMIAIIIQRMLFAARSPAPLSAHTGSSPILALVVHAHLNAFRAQNSFAAERRTRMGFRFHIQQLLNREFD